MDREADAPGRIRSLERVLWVAFPVALLMCAVAVIWRLSLAQLSFLGIGGTCLVIAWMVWRYGLIGYSYSEGFGPPEAEQVSSPLPREILAPLLVVVGVAFLLAGTKTGVGALLHGPASAAVGAWEFLQGTWNLLVSSGLVLGAFGAFVYGLVRRDSDALVAGGVLFALLALAAAGNYAVYLLSEDAWRQEWHDFLEPARTVIELFG